MGRFRSRLFQNQESRRRGKRKFWEEEQEFGLAKKGESDRECQGKCYRDRRGTAGRGNRNGREKVLRKGEGKMDRPMCAGGW